jgi:hypothetical protein
LRVLSAPDTSEIMPTPFTRESMPVIWNTSMLPRALGALTVIRPVVHGNPALVATLVRVTELFAAADFAINPVTFGMLATTICGNLAGGPPGVIVAKPILAPAAARVPG